jgi:HlyD family secretion protein
MKPKWILLLLLIPAFFVTQCGRRDGQQEFKFSGTLEMTEHSVGAKTAGRLVSLSVEEGQDVKKGQLLGTLDRYEQAKKDLARIQELLKEGGATQQTLEYAELALDDQRIVSPVDGIVLVKVYEIGEVVPAGAAVAIVGDTADYWVRIFVPEGSINLLKLNQPADVFLDGIKQPYLGVVSYVSPKAEFTPRNVQTEEERVTQMFAVKVRLQNPPPVIHPGVASDVVFKIKE